MPTFVLTVLGPDRPGLVSDLSAPVSAHGGSWQRSQLTRLAGQFAGVVLVSVDQARAAALRADLEALGDLQVRLEPVDGQAAPTAVPDGVRMELELLGDDRPGIVAEISAALAARSVSIEELVTDVRDAPMAGGTLFEARAVLAAPAGAGTDELRATLEELADELMVEIALAAEVGPADPA